MERPHHSNEDEDVAAQNHMKIETNQSRGHFDAKSMSSPYRSIVADKRASSELGHENNTSLMVVEKKDGVAIGNTSPSEASSFYGQASEFNYDSNKGISGP